ncbi:MAG: hypothetical protein U0M04_00185 [Christensenellales bacterium]|nr:hypothetical protein [Christensenellales bacterium]
MKESRQEDYDLTEEVEQFKNFLRKKYEMDKEKSSGGAVMKKYVSPYGMEMDEEIFAIMMERNPWFTLTAESLPIPCKDEEEMSYLEYKRAIFAYIFGSFGFEKDLAKAELYCCHGISELNKKKPAYPFAANEEWVGWLHNYGELNILLGTVYAYMRKTTRSVYYFMRALNTEALNLNMPYCDFIRYMISKLDDEPCSSADYTGRGFCAEEPMGFLPSKDAFLYAGAALEIIPGLAGLDGEVIVARKCNTSMPYGSMRRYSVADPHQPHMIDVYEVYVIDKQFNLKKASFHFNGYMPHSNRRSIILPDGFTVRQNSPLHKTYSFVSNA